MIRKHGFFLRMFSSAILMQAVLSAASLCVSMILIRRTSDEQYGFYVLITNAVLLLSALQYAYMMPSLVIEVSKSGSEAATRANFVGGLFSGQQRLILWPAAIIMLGAAGLGLTGMLQPGRMWIVMATTVAIVVTLYREFFRMVLLTHRRLNDVLPGDIVYVLLLVAGAFAASFTPMPAAATALMLAGAALVGGQLQRKSLWRFEPWNSHGDPDILRRIFSVGMWATTGSAIHWAFTQGYNYQVAGMLGVEAVAAIAATRLLMMPVNLISTGIGTFMYPTVAGWLQTMTVGKVFQRTLVIALGLSVVAAVYLVILWFLRDWIYLRVLNKDFPRRDTLLLLWSAICVLMVLRDQLTFILSAQARFRPLSAVALASAVISLSISYLLMSRIGTPGALVGILIGEAVSVVGIVALTLRRGTTEGSVVPR